MRGLPGRSYSKPRERAYNGPNMKYSQFNQYRHCFGDGISRMVDTRFFERVEDMLDWYEGLRAVGKLNEHTISFDHNLEASIEEAASKAIDDAFHKAGFR